MPGITFDPASEYYDRTRGYPPGVAESIRDAIISKVHSDTPASLRFLELGVGTGRIALPFIQAGYNFVGVDLSLAMMAQLKNKLAASENAADFQYELLQADVMDLPFGDNSFDVAITVHVLHLVDNWQQVVREAHRVLRKPGGYLFIGNDTPTTDISPTATILANKQWYNILRDYGIDRDTLQPGLTEATANRDELLEAFLQQLGAQVARVDLFEYETLPLSPRMMVQRHLDRLYSSDWRIPDDIYSAASKRLSAWLDTECPEPDRAFSITNAFRAIVAKW